MKRTACFAAFAALTASCDVLATGSIAQVTILDRVHGVELAPHFYHGEYWVAGTPGATYAIVIRNRLGERVLAVTSVDGVNVISGATASWDQTGYVFDPGEGYQIEGWRKSDEEVAAFTFTESPNSYAERTGRPANVGVIGVAIFRERPPQPVYAPPVIKQSPDRSEPARSFKAYPPEPSPKSTAKAPAAGASTTEVTVQGRRLAADSAYAASAPIAAMPAPAPQFTAPGDSFAAPAAQPSPSPVAPVPTLDPKLGTGHGEREYSYVRHVDFTRMRPEPNEVIRIRYDSLENLIAMGIVERPHPMAPKADPFPASSGEQYAPDPPGDSAGELQ
jgi:hypothetical protein